MAKVKLIEGGTHEMSMMSAAVGLVATSIELNGRDAMWMVDHFEKEPAYFRAWLHQFAARFPENRFPAGRIEVGPEPSLGSLSVRQMLIASALYELDPDSAASFRWISEKSGVEPESTARLVTRKLAKLGVTEFVKGLMTDEGEVAGSGYRLTALGRRMVATARAAS